MDALHGIETAKAALLKGIDTLDRDIQQKADRRNKLSEETAEIERNHSANIAKSERKLAELGEKITKNSETHEKLLADIEAAKKELELAKTELQKVKKAHKDFMEYRKRANAVLESHEQAIIEKEEKLDTILSTAKRRTKILADL